MTNKPNYYGNGDYRAYPVGGYGKPSWGDVFVIPFLLVAAPIVLVLKLMGKVK